MTDYTHRTTMIDDNALATDAVKVAVTELTKGGIPVVFGWVRKMFSGAKGREAAANFAERPDVRSAQDALKAHLLELLLTTPAFAEELRALLGPAPATTTTYAAQSATGNTGQINLVQGSGNIIGDH